MSGVREDFRGDYLGFSYNGKHSSELGIVRTSNGSRFNENLLPTIQDKTVQVPGGDGTYFFGSYYTQRQISVPIAFDNLTELQFKEMRKVFGDKGIHELIFDEAPYKAYQAKVTGTAQIKHLVFNEGEGRERIYKGSGTIQFTCYQPYAVCTKKWQDQYKTQVSLTESTYKKNKYYIYNKLQEKYVIADNEYEETETYYENMSNIGEWAEASGLLVEQDDYDKVLGAPSAGHIKLYNPGDIDTHFKLTIKFDDNGTINAGRFSIRDKKRTKMAGELSWKEFGAKPIDEKTKDSGVVFNTQTNLVEGIDENGKKTGNLYNQYVAGAFFKIPLGEWELRFTNENDENFEPHGDRVKIEYNYYYI